MCTVFVTHVRNYIMGATPEKKKTFTQYQRVQLTRATIEDTDKPARVFSARTYMHGRESLKMYTHHKLAVILF